MKLTKIAGLLISLLFLLSAPIGAAQGAAPLKIPDIHRIMLQIFAEHVGERGMTPELMQNAVNLYIDHFDASRLYLLDSEAQPYNHLSKEELQKAVQDFQNQDYAIFTRLDSLFQKAIFRARTLRHLSEGDRSALFDEAAKPGAAADDAESDGHPAFTKAQDELRQRWHNSIVDQVRFQMSRFGRELVTGKQRDVIAHLEGNVREAEKTYLYTNDKNVSLDADTKQHLFAMHVLKALATSLDPHTAVFDDVEAFEMKTHLDKGFEGIGVVFAESPEGFLVNEILPNSPAAASNVIKAKDIILAVNGEKLEGKSLEEVVELVRNHPHEHPVTLLLKHNGDKGIAQIVEVKLVPQQITLNSDRTESGFEPFQDGIVGWITLHSFYEGGNGVNSAADISKAITELQTHGKLKGLVLDLRDNGGGYLTQAVKVAGLFISNGVVVISKYNDGSEHFYREIHGKATYDGPLVILASRATASAAEIVAQTLQDYGVALVAGDDRTYGKGTIQAQTVTEDGSTSYFKVTVGKYYTVSGKTTQIKGVHSDILVPGPYSQLHIGEAYLSNPLPNDSIEPAYNDTLQDIDPFVRDWYLRYYVPTLQHKTDEWSRLVPELQRLSTERISQDKQYQSFLQKIHHSGSPKTVGAVDSGDNAQKNDVQMKEALNILKDMTRLDSKVVGK